MRIFYSSRIFGEDRCASKSEKMIFFEALNNSSVHITKLTAVTFVKDNDNVFVIYSVSLVFLDKSRKLLNCCDDYMSIIIFQLLFEYGC